MSTLVDTTNLESSQESDRPCEVTVVFDLRLGMAPIPCNTPARWVAYYIRPCSCVGPRASLFCDPCRNRVIKKGELLCVGCHEQLSITWMERIR